MSDPKNVSEIFRAYQRFASRMISVLLAPENLAKTSWRDDSVTLGDLFERLEMNVAQLGNGISTSPVEEYISETEKNAIDVANYAFFLFDIAEEERLKLRGAETPAADEKTPTIENDTEVDRKNIDYVDDQLLKLLAFRLTLSTRIIRRRLEAGGNALDPAREDAIVARLKDRKAAPLTDFSVEQLWRYIFATGYSIVTKET